MKRITDKQSGYSLVEVLLAIGVFGFVASGVTLGVIYGTESSAIAGKTLRATNVAEQGIEAVRSIRDRDFAALANGTYGVTASGGVWALSGTSDTWTDFTRTVAISTVDAKTKQVVSTVTYPETAQRNGTVSLTSYLSNWRANTIVPVVATPMLVYADGGTTGDTIQYQTFDATAGSWSAPALISDVDAGTTNRSARIVKIYSDPTGNGKRVVVSRHYNGTTQYIYGQVFDGSTWGNVQLLGQWNAATVLDAENFAGEYTQAGTFYVVYSDNTTIPKYRTWDGSAWSTEVSLATLGAGNVPYEIILKRRLSTNELMLGVFTQSSDTYTNYFSGTAWGGSYVSHATNANSGTTRLMDFAWSPNSPLVGALVFSDKTNDRTVANKIFTANGLGGGAWSAKTNTANRPVTENLGSVSVSARNGTTSFVTCVKTNQAAPKIYCYDISAAGAFSNPTNQLLIAGSTPGTQRGVDVAYESLATGDRAVAVYSDNGTQPKEKYYTPTTTTWLASPATVGTLSGIVQTVRAEADSGSNDILFMVTDANRTLYTVLWNGTTNALYASPAGKALLQHGTNGSVAGEFWYDFTW